MTHLRKMMLEELQRRNYSEDTTRRGMRVKQSVSPELDQKAAEVLSRWTYDPARLKGLPVPMEMMMEVNFHLH